MIYAYFDWVGVVHIFVFKQRFGSWHGMPFRVGQCVEVVLLEELEDSSMKKLVTDISEKKWLRSVATNPVFDFLSDEDIYSLSDGKSLKS